jgi:DNA topoisomerase-1
LNARGNLISDQEKIARIEELAIPLAWRDVFEPEWTCALAVRLINLGWFRVGTDLYARTTKTFGITTLRKSHVSVRGSTITFRYRSKHRSWVRSAAVDAELAEAMKKLLALPGGSRPFRYRYEDSFCNLTGARLNEYINEQTPLQSPVRLMLALPRRAVSRR